MKLKNILLALLIMSSSIFASEIIWAKDFQSGILEAKEKNKPVLFVFSRHTCHYCKVLEDTTFQDKEVIRLLNENFVSIVSYTDEKDYTPRELWRPGTPTLWFLEPSGEPMFQPIVGAVGAESFLNALDIVKKEFDSKK